MTGEPLHLHPEKHRSIAGTDFLHRRARCLIKFFNFLPLDLLPVAGLKDSEHERICFPSRHADAIGIVFDDEKERQLFFFCERNSLVKVALTSCGVTDCRDDNIPLSIELDAPGNPACRKKLRTGWRRHTPDMQIRIAVMRRHLPAAASSVALGEIFEPELPCRHTTPENKTAIPIIRNDVIVWLHEK